VPRNPFLRRVVLLGLVTIAARVVYVLVLGRDDNPPIQGSDRFFFTTVAGLIAHGHGFVEPFTWTVRHRSYATAGHPPLWPALLAVPSLLGHGGYLAARLAGAVLGGLTAAVAALLGREVGGERVGMVAGVLVALYLPFFSSDASGMSETLYALLVAASLLLAAVAARAASVRIAVAAGVLMGLAALTRTEGLLLVLLVAAVALPALAPARRGPLAAAFLVAAALTVVPWTIRNAAQLDRLVPVSTNDSAVIAGSNCPETYAGREKGLWDVRCVFRASGRAGLPYREGVLAGRWRHAGLEYARHHLGRLVPVAAVRVLRTWSLWQPRWQARLYEGENRTVSQIGLLWWLLLAPAAIAGAVMLRRRRIVWLLLAPAVAATLTSAVGWGFPRFRHAAEVPLLVLAAVAMTWLVARRSEAGIAPIAEASS